MLFSGQGSCFGSGDEAEGKLMEGFLQLISAGGEGGFFNVRHFLLTFVPDITEADDHLGEGQGDLELVPRRGEDGVLHVDAHRNDAGIGAVGKEEAAILDFMARAGRAIDSDAGMHQLVFHHAGKAEQGTHAATGTGAAHRTYVIGRKDTFKVVAILAGADDSHHLEMARNRDERKKFIVPEAEDKAFAARMGGVHGFAVLFLDAKRGTDSLIKVDEQE